MTFAAITAETSSHYFVKLSLSPQKSSHGTFLDSLTVDLFKIPDVDEPFRKGHMDAGLQSKFLPSLWPGQKSARISFALAE